MRMFYKPLKQRYLGFALTCLSISTPVLASDFSLPFVNAADLGTVYAGWAATAADASTTYMNPAGLVRLKNQQLVLAGVGINSRARFTGTTMPPFPPAAPQTGSASSNFGVFLPSFFYAVPINDRLVFGIGETVPFGLGTSYAKTSIVRYAGTFSQVGVVDFMPSLGAKVTDAFSVGFGLDIQRLAFTLNSMYGPPLSTPDSEGQNYLTGWGLGWHGGVLFQVPRTRIGFSYNSMTMYHTTGYSQVFGPAGNFRYTSQKTNAAMPARAQLSVVYDISKPVTLMGTVFYVNWSTLSQITMKHTMLPGGMLTSVTIPFDYHNTLDYAVGATYQATEKWKLRLGVDFANTPSNNRTRSIVDPIGCFTMAGIGAHYQQNRQFGYDVGYAHSFFQQTPINTITPITSTIGHNRSSTNIYGGQFTWDIV